MFLKILTYYIIQPGPCKNVRSDITLVREASVPSHWQPWWALRPPAAESAKRQDNLTVTLGLEGKRDFDSIICSYSGTNSERGTISYLNKRVVKYGLWKNLFFMKQNESLNPVLLTLPPEITELC